MDGRFDFFVGLILGILLGGLGVYAMVRIRGWFTSSEIRNLRHLNRQLHRRIKQKDQHIEEMLRRAEVVARELQSARETDAGRAK
jgi:hypothetical protein